VPAQMGKDNTKGEILTACNNMTLSRRIGKKKTRPGRPTQFEIQLEMAKISWAPVLECLSLLDSKRYNSIEDIPIVKEAPVLNMGSRVLEVEGHRDYTNEPIVWITGKQIKKIHDDLIEAFGGTLGIADESQLDAVIQRAKNSTVYNEDQLPTIVHKAAFFMHSLLRYHQFADGQKRTGLSTAFIFLGLNGYSFWSRDVLPEVHYCIEIAQGKHEVKEITKWLSNRIWKSDILTPELTTLNKILLSRNMKVRCTQCHSFISASTFRTKCARCGREYEIKISNFVWTRGISGQIEFNVGLHKLEDSELVKSGVITLDKFNK
jgi:death-on-curing family protein